MRVRKAVFPAAGWGTRFLPATKAQPKEMLPLVDKPVIQYAVEEAVASGIEQVIIVQRRHRLAAARLADDAERLAAAQFEGDVIDGADDAVWNPEGGCQLPNAEEGCFNCHRYTAGLKTRPTVVIKSRPTPRSG